MQCACMKYEVMPTLQVRDLPEHIYEALKKAARDERRSLSQQAIVALELGLNLGAGLRTRREELLNEWRKQPLDLPHVAEPDITSWVRDDRENR